MKKVLFLLFAAICVLAACDPTVKEGKCDDLAELQEAVLNNSTDTARYDLNKDGEINIADINYLLSKIPADTTKVECDSTDTL